MCAGKARSSHPHTGNTFPATQPVFSFYFISVVSDFCFTAKIKGIVFLLQHLIMNMSAQDPKTSSFLKSESGITKNCSSKLHNTLS